MITGLFIGQHSQPPALAKMLDELAKTGDFALVPRPRHQREAFDDLPAEQYDDDPSNPHRDLLLNSGHGA